MTMLGTLTLSDDLVLAGLDNAPVVAFSQRRTTSGRSVIRTDPVVGGRTLSLQSERHLTLADVTAIRALAAQNEPVTLVHHRGTFTVKVVGTPVEMDDVELYSNPPDDTWYSGEITLIEV